MDEGKFMRTISIALLALAPISFTACLDASDASDPADASEAVDTADAPAPFQPLLQHVFTAADPASAYNQLSADEQSKVDLATRPYGDLITHSELVPVADEPADEAASAAGEPSHVAAAKFAGCWALHFTGKRKAFFGNTLYTYWQNTNVCVSGGKVTKVWVTDAGGETSTPGWRITHAPTTSTYNARWEGRGKGQYYFVLGVGGWDIQHPSDCLQGRLNADGSHYRAMTSCDLQAK
jgi:hypothetical protein